MDFYLPWICYGVCLNEKLFVFRYVVFHETLCRAETIWNDCECLEKITIISTVTMFYLIPWFPWWRRRMKTLSALFALWEDDPSMTVGFPHTGLLMQNVMFSSPLSWHAVEQTVELRLIPEAMALMWHRSVALVSTCKLLDHIQACTSVFMPHEWPFTDSQQSFIGNCGRQRWQAPGIKLATLINGLVFLSHLILSCTTRLNERESPSRWLMLPV